MYSNNKKDEGHTLSTSLKTNGFKVKTLNSTTKFSVIEVSFEKFYHYLLIWNKKISNKNEYKDLCNISSTFKEGEFIIVGDSMIDEGGNDKLELFAEETKLHIKKMLYLSDEYDIINHLKQEYFSHYVDELNIKNHHISELFVYYMTGITVCFSITAINHNIKLFNKHIENITKKA
ncbi:1518_t:CDS:1 [Cetraspora pellucida]|uniref:1518_t:CDS:1 n=1 Tax=Cetraspora pellucida TaxID=1433469 RepID=A0ACA9NS84_9GLOM|nr:1518_t:CDS:1 [Cetraspora pellucida]